jgi:acetyl esterase
MSTPTPDPFTQLLASTALPKTAKEMRDLLDGLAPLLNAGAPEVGAFHPKVPVAGAGPAVTSDVVVPKGRGPWPVLVYLHGGGWVCGSPTTHRKLVHRFAEAGYLVFNVDYRLAPEHPFPTPLDDCVASIRFAAREAERFGGDPSRLAIGGDSAGGNLSAAAAIALADDAEVAIRAALLIYGVFDFAKLGGLTPAQLEVDPKLAEAGERMTAMMVDAYLGAERSPSLMLDPRVSPIHAAEKLPPSHVLCGTGDPLHAQTLSLVEALARAGVDHEVASVEGMPHGFVQMEFLPAARQAIERMVAFLDARLRSGS